VHAADGWISDARLPDHGVRRILGTAARRQRYLDVEAALAAAQAQVGLVPEESAAVIAYNSRLDKLDVAALDEGQARTGHLMMPLVTELARACGEEHGGWVHWGATTQNIQQTGDVLGVRQAHAVLVELVLDVLDACAVLAETHAHVVMPGRTHGQQAVPITFGFKVAAWADAMLRHLERLEGLRERMFVAMTGGATGTFAAMGQHGPRVQDLVAERLGLGSMALPSRSIADPFGELVTTIALMSATGSTIAYEVSRLSAAEVGEVRENLPPDDVGSTTMPQKRNAKLCQDMVTIGAHLRSLTGLALEAVIHAGEVDGAASAMMDEAVEQSLILAADQLVRLAAVLNELEVFPARMRANLDLTGGAIMAEALMMGLAESLGRQDAHELVHEAAMRSVDNQEEFANVVASDPRVTAALTPGEIKELLDPASHIGLSVELARATAQRARGAVAARRPITGSMPAIKLPLGP
jgi:3-carboxy-cis,cis-muconate cycloisomerase